MALAEWELFVNRFEKATRGNNTKAIAVGSQHCTSLFADSATVPVALTCYNLVKPKFDLFKEAHLAHECRGLVHDSRHRLPVTKV